MDTTLFDKIICAITSEKERKANRKLLALFLTLFFASLALMPFSVMYLVAKWKSSGIFYFITTPFSDISIFLRFWQDFLLSIVESFPVMAVAIFSLNISLLLFSVILWSQRKKI